MALSYSESALLNETCANMNVAANTCREVLEMLRNLGNTGVVDIAEHDTASEVHESAANLAKIDSSGNMFLGAQGECGPSAWSAYRPFYMQRNGSIKAYCMLSRAIKEPGETKYNNMQFYQAYTQNGSPVAKSSLYGLWGAYSLPIFRIAADCVTSDASDKVAIEFSLGSHGEEAYKSTSLKISVNSTAGTNAYHYEAGPNAFFPYGAALTISLGKSGYPFDTAYLRTAATVTSDRREKSGIAALDAKAAEFIKLLRPVQFTVAVGSAVVSEASENGDATKVDVVPGTRRHWGLIAQEVQEALVSAGYDPSDCAVWSLSDKDDPDSKQALRYEELIAPMIKVIQQQQERIEALERRIA